ncbi:tubulin-like doman-containing protein [Saccharothrix deserti]|uniref:tubulin-like doman-containing protein n=1 Tax=Saccharothrix deserti TaxID=2593674 RepID=UPI00131D409D|nr:tubulin-like doman-containing protein [Saccharothrix deserti]
MRIYQPMLFVGLGGTGCKVGAEFEKRLREELCGPDGTRLLSDIQNPNFLPYQLPSCLQFVYADLSANELQRVRREVVPGREHEQAAQKTMHQIADLVPARLGNSAEVSESLRINLDDQTVGWLPSRESDPRIGPLVRGAGQLPTVGRGVLFETIRRNPDTALLGIKDAIADINESAGDLFVVSGKRTQRVDPVIVFVVFSVAGGTGSGIYYDYLHLIGELMKRGGKEAEIYPLVLMPSAFDDGQGGGRPADLNAGSALVDLFRLIDDQNAQGTTRQLDESGSYGAVSVRYPQLDQVQLLPNTVQTAFLFGRPVGGVRRDDLNRSMVSLMTSLIGAGPTEDDENDEGANQPYHSFADGFINGKVDRHAIADTGVGRRGVTTSAVAALTTPLLELTDVVSSHLLANAVNELLVPPGAAETNKQHIRQFITASGLDRLLEATPSRIPPPGNPVGYGAVAAAMTQRAEAMKLNVDRGHEALAGPIATLAQDFDPTAAAAVLLRDLDLFRLERVVFGHRDLVDPLDKGGFRSLLEGWRTPPPAPPGLNVATPPLPKDLRRKITQRLRISDESVQAVLRQQDAWYAWQTRRIWNGAWNDSHRLWSRPWGAFVEELGAIRDQFLSHARNDPHQFDLRSRDLYKSRVGVTYLLPAEDRGLEGFYQSVFTRLKQDFAQYLSPNPHEGHVLNLLLGQDGWATAFAKGRQDPEAAVAYIRQRIKEAVTERLRPGDRSRPALVPRMDDLLANAVQRRDGSVTEGDLNRFRQKLAELVPGGFAPDGHGPLKALFTYPAAQRNDDIERFLRREVSLPVDMVGEPEFRAVQADTMVVVLNRSSMGVTEVPELRRVVRLWAEAQRHPQPQDTLSWRRRLSQDSDYLLMGEQDRKQVLHRLLCAAWDGKITIDGPPASPHHVTVEVGGRDAVAMKLELSPLGSLSSWATLMQAYERWILTDDNPTRRSLARRLMSSVPEGADRFPSPPKPQFAAIVDLAGTELQKIKEAEQHAVLGRDPQLAVFREFWSRTLPEALRQPVGITTKSLLDLREQVDVAHGLGGDVTR